MSNNDITRKHSAGFSLVELMIAMVIGLVLIAGIVQVFVASRSTYAVADGLARLQENGRFAIGFLTRDLRVSGQTGCARCNINSFLDPTQGGNSTPFNVDSPISGFEYTDTDPAEGDSYTITSMDPSGASATNWTDGTQNLNAVLSDLNGNVVEGTDVLFLRGMRSLPNLTLKNNNNNLTSASLNFTDSTGLGQGQIVMVANAGTADLFQNTQKANASSTSRGSGCGGEEPCNVTPNNSNPWSSAWDSNATVYALMSKAYYIGAADADGDGTRETPGLWEIDFSSGTGSAQTRELLRGVENMQVLYGVDTQPDATRRADQYVSADDVTSTANGWQDVVAVRVALLVRTNDEIPQTGPGAGNPPITMLSAATGAGNTLQITPQNDRRARRVFSTTVAIRNLIMRK
ncbi:PilW family protein [Arhodomonas sp. AD133]|uniref:PilW family protein n=1 Tax=Arhodomonas sp. AD133 TaxID=3415009 RepID=UPI003EB93115